jgi:hypothetical protein
MQHNAECQRPVSQRETESYTSQHNAGGHLAELVLHWVFFEHFRIFLASCIFLPMLYIHLLSRDGATGIFEAIAPKDSMSHCYREVPEYNISSHQDCFGSKITSRLTEVELAVL